MDCIARATRTRISPGGVIGFEGRPAEPLRWPTWPTGKGGQFWHSELARSVAIFVGILWQSELARSADIFVGTLWPQLVGHLAAGFVALNQPLCSGTEGCKPLGNAAVVFDDKNVEHASVDWEKRATCKPLSWVCAAEANLAFLTLISVLPRNECDPRTPQRALPAA